MQCGNEFREKEGPRNRPGNSRKGDEEESAKEIRLKMGAEDGGEYREPVKEAL